MTSRLAKKSYAVPESQSISGDVTVSGTLHFRQPNGPCRTELPGWLHGGLHCLVSGSLLRRRAPGYLLVVLYPRNHAHVGKSVHIALSSRLSSNSAIR